MSNNAVRDKLLSGGWTWGTFIYLASPSVVEVAGAAGVDFAIIDTEHMARDQSQVESLVRAAEIVSVTPIVRVRENSPKLILQALEAGAQGIAVPFVQTADDVVRARRATRYPPEGIRGACMYTRATHWGGAKADYQAYAAAANESVMLIGLVEDQVGVANINEILDAGLDVAFVGRRDLAMSMGIYDLTHPKVVEAVRTVEDAIERHESGCSLGIVSYTPSEAADWRRRGCKFICHSIDVAVLRDGYSAVAVAFEGSAASLPAGVA